MLSPEPTWYTITHRVLETLYYVSGIAVAVLVGLGLRQIRLTKEIAEANKKREAVKLAATQCNYFAEQALQNLGKLDSLLEKLDIECFDPPQWKQKFPLTMDYVQFVQPSSDLKIIESSWDEIGWHIANCLNSFESFAIPFAAGVADDAVGFQEGAAVFCDTIRRFLPAIWYIRRDQDARYPSALSLYCMWENRREAEKVAPLAKNLQALVDIVDQTKVEPI
jgi:hypothetical protein